MNPVQQKNYSTNPISSNSNNSILIMNLNQIVFFTPALTHRGLLIRRNMIVIAFAFVFIVICCQK